MRWMTDASHTAIRYYHRDQFPGWDKAPTYLKSIISAHSPQTLLEIGCGPNPTLSLSDLPLGHFRYIISDLHKEELEKAPVGYEARVLDLEARDLTADLLSSCDLVFSRMVNEHTRNGSVYHRNILRLLRPGGLAAHCFATLYSLPFLVNKLVPEYVADNLLDFFAPRDRHTHNRFTAHYSWCRGPSKAMIRKFEEIGYDVLNYSGYFGHEYYKDRLRLLHKIHRKKSKYLEKHPIPLLCSYATVILRKPS